MRKHRKEFPLLPGVEKKEPVRSLAVEKEADQEATSPVAGVES